MDQGPLRGQRALVTGASSGIGEGVARAPGAAGADVVGNHVNYAASKGGVKLFMQSLAQEVAPHRIRVNSVAPGAIRTSINHTAWETPEALAALLTLIPYGRIGLPEDIGKVVTFIVSDDAD